MHENVILGDDIDLSILPVPRYSPDDGGPYITPGFVVSHDPETGVPDIGHYRCEIIDSQDDVDDGRPEPPVRQESGQGKADGPQDIQSRAS